MQQCYEGSYYFPVLNKKHFPTCDAFNKPKCVSQTRRSIYIYIYISITSYNMFTYKTKTTLFLLRNREMYFIYTSVHL